MNPIIAIVDFLLWCVQGLIMLVLIVPLQRTAQGMSWVSWKLIKHVYYHGIVLLRRRVSGKPMWKDTDLMLGIQPPPSEIERLTRLAEETRAGG